MYNLNLWVNIGNTIKEGFFGICILLDGLIYGLVSSSYKIFMALAGARILNTTMFSDIANKIYIIIGVVMLFVLAYALLRGIINPDNNKNGNTSAPNLLKSIIIAVLGLALTPVVFNVMYQAQDVFVQKDILGRIIFRDVDDVFAAGTVSMPTYDDSGAQNGTVDIEVGDVKPNEALKQTGGALVATQLFKAFFYPDPAGGGTPETILAADRDRAIKNETDVILGAGLIAAAVCCVIPGIGWIAGAAITGITLAATAITVAIVNEVTLSSDDITLEYAYYYSSSGNTGSFDIFSLFIKNYLGIDDKGNDLPDDQRVNYLWGISGIAGIFALYAFVSFSIDMAVRCVKLAYYQIIAPVPLMLQVLPNFKSNFNKYLSSVFATFAEVFIRISVVYIVIYLIANISNSTLFNNDTMEMYSLNYVENALAIAMLIIGLITFAKAAPKIISDTFGIQSGSMSFGITKKLADGGALVAGAAIGSGVTGMVRNGINSFKGKEKYSSFGKGVGTVLKGIGSTAAGGLSGALRAGYGARGAKNFSDMAKASSAANEKVTQKRDQREAYAEEHAIRDSSGNIVKAGKVLGAVKGHLKDAGQSIAGWAGVNNTDALRREQSNIQTLQSSYKGLKSSVNDFIEDAAATNKHATIADSSYVPPKKAFSRDLNYFARTLGEFSSDTSRMLKDLVEQARANNGSCEVKFKTELGTTTSRTFTMTELKQLEESYNKSFADELSNLALLSDSAWQGLDPKFNELKLNMAEVRTAADTLKSELQKNANAPIVSVANQYADDMTSQYNAKNGTSISATHLDVNVKNQSLDITDKNSALGQLSLALKNRAGEVAGEIRKRERFTSSSDKGGSSGKS